MPLDFPKEDPIFTHAYQGNLSALQQAYAQNQKALNLHSQEGYTPLMIAAVADHLDVVLWLEQHAQANIAEKDKQGRNVLLLAASAGHRLMLEYLLKSDKLSLEDKDNNGRTALMHAVNSGQLTLIKWLVKHVGAELNQKDNLGMTPLMLAVSERQLAVVEWLLKRDRSLLLEKDNSGHTALMYAANLKQSTILIVLLQFSGANLLEKDSMGKNVLNIAKRNNQAINIQALYYELKRQQLPYTDLGISTAQAAAFDLEKRNAIVRYLALHQCLKVAVSVSELSILINSYQNLNAGLYLNSEERACINNYLKLVNSFESYQKKNKPSYLQGVINPLQEGRIPSRLDFLEVQLIFQQYRINYLEEALHSQTTKRSIREVLKPKEGLAPKKQKTITEFFKSDAVHSLPQAGNESLVLLR